MDERVNAMLGHNLAAINGVFTIPDNAYCILDKLLADSNRRIMAVQKSSGGRKLFLAHWDDLTRRLGDGCSESTTDGPLSGLIHHPEDLGEMASHFGGPDAPMAFDDLFRGPLPAMVPGENSSDLVESPSRSGHPAHAINLRTSPTASDNVGLGEDAQSPAQRHGIANNLHMPSSPAEVDGVSWPPSSGGAQQASFDFVSQCVQPTHAPSGHPGSPFPGLQQPPPLFDGEELFAMGSFDQQTDSCLSDPDLFEWMDCVALPATISEDPVGSPLSESGNSMNCDETGCGGVDDCGGAESHHELPIPAPPSKARKRSAPNQEAGSTWKKSATSKVARSVRANGVGRSRLATADVEEKDDAQQESDPAYEQAEEILRSSGSTLLEGEHAHVRRTWIKKALGVGTVRSLKELQQLIIHIRRKPRNPGQHTQEHPPQSTTSAARFWNLWTQISAASAKSASWSYKYFNRHCDLAEVYRELISEQPLEFVRHDRISTRSQRSRESNENKVMLAYLLERSQNVNVPPDEDELDRAVKAAFRWEAVRKKFGSGMFAIMPGSAVTHHEAQEYMTSKKFDLWLNLIEVVNPTATKLGRLITKHLDGAIKGKEALPSTRFRIEIMTSAELRGCQDVAELFDQVVERQN